TRTVCRRPVDYSGRSCRGRAIGRGAPVNGLSNTQLVLLGTSLLGGVAGVIGSFAVLRRRALVGDLLAHSALPGLCVAFLLLNSSSTLGRAGGETASATH